MSADYCRILAELQESKKEVTSLRNKNNTLVGTPSIIQPTTLFWNPTPLLGKGP